MRKFLLISLLAATGMVYGCGYGDGKDIDNGGGLDDKTGPLPQLSSSCKTNADCMVGINIVGDCIAGVCRRFCETTDDCEKDTICEGNICQPVVDCPVLTFEDQTKNAEYEGKKCVKVFEVSPSVTWSQLLKGDLVLNKDNSKLFGKTTDFTSNDFSFELPHSVLSGGLNFSMVTYLAINYLKLMIGTSTLMARCTKPEVNIGGEWKKPDSVSYSANYEYTISDDKITPATLISICDDATYLMDEDMQQYYTYVTKDGNCKDKATKDEKLRCVFDEYKNMIQQKPVCHVAMTGLTVLKGFSNIMMQVGMTAASSSSGYEGADAMSKWLENIKDKDGEDVNDIQKLGQIIYQTDFNKNSNSYGASFLDLDCLNPDSDVSDCTLGVFRLKYCDLESWKKNVKANGTLRRSLSEEDYMKSKKRIRFCNEADAGKVVTDSNDDTVTFNNAVYKFDSSAAQKLNMDILKKNAMKSQLGSCVYMLKGIYDFSLMRLLARSEDILLATCGFHEKFKNATVNVNMQTDEYKKFLGMLDDVKTALAGLSDTDIAAMSPLLSAESLYGKATDPSYIWLTGDSLFPLVINNSTGHFQNHDLILDVVYRPTSAMFETSQNSYTPLSESIKFYSYHGSEVIENDDALLSRDPTKSKFEIDESVAHDYVSVFTYSDKNISSDSHATVLYHKDGTSGCPGGKCKFYWMGHKEKDSSTGMVCGGITIILNHADGYVILNDDDTPGTREVISVQN